MFLPGFTRVRQAKAYLEYCGARYGLRNRNRTQFIASDSGVFTQDWFSYHIPLWKRVLEPFVAKPIRALEIGVFEGRSAVWLLDHVLTHPESTFTWIDPFIGPTHRVGIDHPNDLEARFRNNIGRFGGKTQGYVGRSQEVLREFSSVRFDLIYIDGAHFAPDVLADAVLSWPLLRSGGLMGFDDYGWVHGGDGWTIRGRPSRLSGMAAEAPRIDLMIAMPYPAGRRTGSTIDNTTVAGFESHGPLVRFAHSDPGFHQSLIG